jgi:hypothetical protein
MGCGNLEVRPGPEAATRYEIQLGAGQSGDVNNSGFPYP